MLILGGCAEMKSWWRFLSLEREACQCMRGEAPHAKRVR